MLCTRFKSKSAFERDIQSTRALLQHGEQGSSISFQQHCHKKTLVPRSSKKTAQLFTLHNALHDE